jgi:hypothetical protein
MQNEAQYLGAKLVENNLIPNGTTVSARVTVKGFGHSIMTTEKDGVVLSSDKDGINAMYEDSRKRYTKFADLTAIEGMDLARFAQAYRIKMPGKKKKA